MTSENTTTPAGDDLQRCDRCGQQFIEQHAGLCSFFGVTNQRLIATGFLLYDPTVDADVPDFDGCDRTDCPGRGASA